MQRASKKHGEFAISVADIDASGKHYAAAIPVEWLKTILEGAGSPPPKPIFGDGQVDVQLFKSGTDVVVRGHAKAKIQLLCGRCLEPVEVTLAPEISALLVPTGKLKHAGKDEHELTAAEADVMPFDGETVVLDDLLRDELVLDIPMIPLCSESCPGISTHAKAPEPAVDPRLAPLLAFTKKKKKKE